MRVKYRTSIFNNLLLRTVHGLSDLAKDGGVIIVSDTL